MKYIEKYWIVIIIVFFFSMFIKPALCFLIVGSIAFYAGISAIVFLKNIRTKGIKATGRILSYEAGNKGYKTPVIEFTTIGGEAITAKPFVYASTDLSKIRSYSSKIDTEVLLLYDAKDPEKFVLEEEKEFNYVVFIVFMLAGLAFIVFSFLSFLGYIDMG